MKIHYLICLYLLLIGLQGMSQTKDQFDEETFSLIESMPCFPGCENELNETDKQNCSTIKVVEFITKKTKYPRKAKRKGIVGKVYISYVIDTNGNIIDVELLKGVEGGELLNEEALRVVSSLPKHKPGVQDGKSVMVRYNIPINFTLTENKN